MPAWSPLLVQKIEIHALGFVLRKLQLNRHRDAEVASHGHDFAQLILYLNGEGVQTVNGRRRRARAGDLFVIPAATPHGFLVAGRSRPLCLVLDYEMEGSSRVRVAHRTLSPATLNELHALLVRVPRKGRLTLGDYPAILAVVARLLAAPEGAAASAAGADADADAEAEAEAEAEARRVGFTVAMEAVGDIGECIADMRPKLRARRKEADDAATAVRAARHSRAARPPPRTLPLRVCFARIPSPSLNFRQPPTALADCATARARAARRRHCRRSGRHKVRALGGGSGGGRRRGKSRRSGRQGRCEK